MSQVWHPLQFDDKGYNFTDESFQIEVSTGFSFQSWLFVWEAIINLNFFFVPLLKIIQLLWYNNYLSLIRDWFLVNLFQLLYTNYTLSHTNDKIFCVTSKRKVVKLMKLGKSELQGEKQIFSASIK